MKTLLLFLAILGIPSFSFAAKWVDDYDAALRQARRADRHTLLYFTADYCGYCRNLENKALNKGRFGRYADDRLVLFRTEETTRRRQHPRLFHQHQRLRGFYRVNGYPTLIVLRPDGSYAGDIDYRGGDATWLTKEIDRVIKKGKDRDRRRHHRHGGRR